jgi:hypothetical protein
MGGHRDGPRHALAGHCWSGTEITVHHRIDPGLLSDRGHLRTDLIRGHSQQTAQ